MSLVDQFCERSTPFRIMAEQSQVFRVPFEVTPFTREPDGKWGFWWREWAEWKMKLIPKKGDAFDSSWWRPPFKDMIIMSERDEQGLMMILSPRAGFNFSDVTLPGHGQVKPDWGCIVAQLGLDPRTRELMVLMSMRVFSVDGLLHLTKLEEQARDTVSLQKIITPYADEERMYKHALEIWRDNPKDHERDAVNSVATFAIVCGLLCCKNVLTEERAATRQIRRDRERRGLLPLVRWHILKVQVGAQRKQPRSGPSLGGPHEPLASHFVRGHFKTFTKEKPLLGRAVGTFWWSQHVAGRADRVVLKDYEIEKE